MNAVTVPEDKLLELQRKAKLVDELKEVNVILLIQIEAQARVITKLERNNEELVEWLNKVNDWWGLMGENITAIQAAIAKVKGDQ